MKNNNLKKLKIDKELFNSYLLNLDPIIEKNRKKYKLSAEKNKRELLKMLRDEFDSENFAYLSLAKYKIQNLEIYYSLINSYKSNPTIAKKNGIKIPIEEKKIDKLAQSIKDFEESLIHPSDLIITDLIEKHKIPNLFKSLFRDYFFYGEFYKEFLNFGFFSFKDQNISINQDEITKQWYIELKIFGDTKKKDIIDNWPIIIDMQRKLPDYKNPKSKIVSKLYNKLAKAEFIDDLADNGEMSTQKGYRKRLKKLRTQEKRRKKHYNI